MEQDLKAVGTGALKSPNDYRYIKVEHIAGAIPAEFPASFHIDYSEVPDLNQRKIGACTNHAATEIMMKRLARISGTSPLLSPRFIYTLCKIEDGIVDSEEQGTFPVMPFKIGVKYGWATDTTIPNDTTLDFASYIYGRDIKKMPSLAFEEARQNKIPGYAQVGSFNNITEADIKQGLIHGLDGIKLCLPVGSEWYTAVDGHSSWDSKDILPIRKNKVTISGHDIVLTGWDTEEETGRCKILFRNHWGTNWADKDTGWFYLDDHKMTEAWIVSEIPDPLLAIIKSLPSQKDFTYSWEQNVKVGTRGDDVKNLQIALKIIGTFPFNQPVTDYFGNITKGAVQAFQREYKVASEADIVSANGMLGPKTREVLNKLFVK